MPKTRCVQPPLEFIEPCYRPWVIRVVHGLLPIFLQVRLRPWLPAGISRIEVENVDLLVDLYAKQEAGKARFLMAVRHVEIDDPLSGLYLCSRAVARAAAKKGIRLKRPVHTHFMYERGMTIWAGRFIGWLLSRIGGVPIRRGRRPDWMGLKVARKLMLEGNMPMVVAPEGATNGHSERLGPLEPGVAQLGFWCAEDLQRENRTESVYILPIGIQYRYEQANWQKLADLLSTLERRSGLSASENSAMKQTDGIEQSRACQQRIYRLGVYLIEKMEGFYQRCYQTTFEPVKKQSVMGDIEAQSTLDTTKDVLEADSDRLQQLLDRALKVAEQFFHLSSKGSLVDRCRRIEEASWQLIYRDDLPPLAQLSPLDRGLADWAAQEASLRELHMRIVESFVAADAFYVAEKPSFERCAETTLLMSDMLARLSGDKLPARPRLGQRWVKMTVQPPVSVTERLADYQQNRRSGRRAVAALTEELRQALEKTIESS